MTYWMNWIEMKSGRSLLPFKFVGTQISDLFLWDAPCEVFASKHIQSAINPFVIHIFWPLIIKSSPLRTAVVCKPRKCKHCILSGLGSLGKPGELSIP